MNTALLKTFGQKARTLLIDGVTRKLHYWGFDKDGKSTDQPEPYTGGYLFREGVYNDPTVPRLWKSLKSAIAKEGMQEVAERAAYTWFNRLIALQILSKNGYEQPVLQAVNAEEKTPIIVIRARAGQYNFLNSTEKERLQAILTDYEQETGAFAILLIGFCHQHPLLQRVFGSIDDYTELLLPDDILQPGGFVDLLNSGNYITDDDYRQAELIGWLYQFYISEKKDLVFKKFKDGKKAEAADIPAATQIFTPNWIVKYMVENTVGRIWLDKNPDSPIKAGMKYLVEPADSIETPVPIITEAKDLKLLDPAVGSGHILVEGFDLLYKMYEEEYYPADEAVESILQHNLFGLDIDLRAVQLAQFAVLMRAAQHHPDILQKPITPNIHAMPAPVAFTVEDVQAFLGSEGNSYVKLLSDALHLMQQAQNLGSIMQFDWSAEARNFILHQCTLWKESTDLDLMQQELRQKIMPFLNVLEVFTQKHEAVAANPPYMGQANMNGELKQFVNQNFVFAKADFMTVFMEISMELLERHGKMAMINLPSWMFLSSFESFRNDIIMKYHFSSLIHFGRGLFGPDFGTVAFCLEKTPNLNTKGVYRRLFTEHVKVDSVKTKESRFLDQEYGYYKRFQKDFLRIPGVPIAYWISDTFLEIFEANEKLHDVSEPKFGMSVGDGEMFIRKWSEVSFSTILFNAESLNSFKAPLKWAPLDKGGEYRRWYGNQESVVDWENDGYKIRNHPKSAVRSPQYFLRPHISWTLVTAGKFSSRFFSDGFILDTASNCIYFKQKGLEMFLLALLNSKVAATSLDIVNPTINYSCGVVGLIPFLKDRIEIVNQLAHSCLEISKRDWDSRETSWNFFGNRIVLNNLKNIERSFLLWCSEVSADFFTLHATEEALNTIFIEIYGLKDEIVPEILLQNISILQDEIRYNNLIELSRPFHNQLLPIQKDVVIEQLISYAIGCFMGRYRLDKSGLQIAYPNPSLEETSTYNYTSSSTGEMHQIEIDEDAIIPLMGSKGNFRDDIVVRLRQFLVAVWGEEMLTQNINFMQECLGQNVEDYLIKKFWAYHVRIYSKKPIYWLFSSKKGAFQALVYMHRMSRFTVEKLREKYLLKHIRFLEQEVARYQSASASLGKAEQKKLDTMVKDLKECEEYDLLLKDKAAAQTEFDLDDGVTRNYDLFKGVVAPIK